MCDKDSDEEAKDCPADAGLTRRQFGALSVGVGITMLLPGVANALSVTEPVKLYRNWQRDHPGRCVQILKRRAVAGYMVFANDDHGLFDSLAEAQTQADKRVGCPNCLCGPWIESES